jgi:hypothetical protein
MLALVLAVRYEEFVDRNRIANVTPRHRKSFDIPTIRRQIKAL